MNIIRDGSSFVAYGHRSELTDRRLDIEFWQAQPPEARLRAVRELVVLAWKLKGDPEVAERFDRTAVQLVRRGS